LYVAVAELVGGLRGSYEHEHTRRRTLPVCGIVLVGAISFVVRLGVRVFQIGNLVTLETSQDRALLDAGYLAELLARHRAGSPGRRPWARARMVGL
jgi:hypothetical protein